MFIRLSILFLSFYASSVSADWQLETFDHPAENSKGVSAMVRNTNGYELAIFQTTNGTIWMDFSLSDNSFDELAQTPLPMFQIDNQKPIQMLRGFTATIVHADEGIQAVIVDKNKEISIERDFSMNHIIAERLPERVICPIWQGDDRPHLSTVEALGNGEKIKFDFVLSDGTKSHTEFTLSGAKRAISSVINK